MPTGASYPSEPQSLHLENGYNNCLFFFFLPMDLQGVVSGLWHHQRQRELSGAHAQPHPGFLLLRGHGAPSQPEPKRIGKQTRLGFEIKTN